MARTIDNLGVETSSQYAKNKELYDESFLKEAAKVPAQTKVTTTTPSYASEFEALFDLGKRGADWAMTEPPKGYNSTRRKLFSEQIIPSLGPPDAQDDQLEKLQTYPKEISEQAGDEKNLLIKLLGQVQKSDKELIDINSARNQYHKG